MIQIKHSRPSHDYFMICQPESKASYWERVNWDSRPDFEPVIYELQDPKSETSFKAELVDVLRDFNLDGPEGETANLLALVTYGLPMRKLKHELKKKYKEELKGNPKVEFLLLKKI